MYRVNILAGTAWPCSWLEPMSETFGVAVLFRAPEVSLFYLRKGGAIHDSFSHRVDVRYSGRNG
jgi:hypothetical protein